MKRVTEISQLTKGDVIVTIEDHKIVKREFVCVHPHNPKFFNENLRFKDWYLFKNSEEERKELNAMMVEELKNSIAFYEQCSK